MDAMIWTLFATMLLCVLLFLIGECRIHIGPYIKRKREEKEMWADFRRRDEAEKRRKGGENDEER